MAVAIYVCNASGYHEQVNPFTPEFKKYILPTSQRENV